MIWVLGLFQIIFIMSGWWVYKVYFTQPKYAHPMIFWNPLARLALTNGPTLGMFAILILAFFHTDHPWLFAGFTFLALILGAKIEFSGNSPTSPDDDIPH